MKFSQKEAMVMLNEKVFRGTLNDDNSHYVNRTKD